MIDRSATAIELVQQVDAPPELVFAYFTDGARMAQWIEGRAELDPRPGGRYRIEMADGGVAIGQYREIDPPRRLVMTWGWDGSDAIPPESTTIEVTLTAERGGTIIRLRHLGLPDEDWRQRHARGWASRFARLGPALPAGPRVPAP